MRSGQKLTEPHPLFGVAEGLRYPLQEFVSFRVERGGEPSKVIDRQFDRLSGQFLMGFFGGLQTLLLFRFRVQFCQL